VVALSIATSTGRPVHEQVDTAQAASDALRPVEAPPSTTSPPADDPTDDGTAVAGVEERAPLRVMLTGDSVAWTIGYYAPRGDDLPEGIAAVDSRAIIGCGLLSSEGWEYRSEGSDGVFRRAPEACRDQPEAEAIGLSAEPDVVMMLPGAWEWGEVRSPDGEVLGARSPELADVLSDRLMDRIAAAHEVGAHVVLVEWVCPGDEAEDERSDPAFIAWINQLMADVADRGRDDLGAAVSVLGPNVDVCEGGDALGRPTPAKDDAMANEVHVQTPEGGRWVWDTWLGPELIELV
jgi:hypothetical protein